MQTDFERRILDVYGPRGRKWLDGLPARVQACERRWAISVEGEFDDLSYNWVARATTRDGMAVVLKLSVPSAERTAEIEALRAWGGRGAARLVAADDVAGALLVERLVPGTKLATLVPDRDDEATAIAMDVTRALHSASTPESGLPTLEDWTAGLLCARAQCFAPSLVARACEVRETLLQSAPSRVLLHGDLHHDNILAAGRARWLAIDPKGIVGDPTYEPAAFLYNPLDQVLQSEDSHVDHLIVRRVDRFANVLDRDRVLAWGFVQAVLSAWWTFDDHGSGHEPALRFAERLARIR